MEEEKIIHLRMERQCFVNKADEAEYLQLYRDTQPGQNVYWNGFGQPPTLTFRADFDDIEYNRKRQLNRTLIKGRFAGGNLGWIMPEDLELFAALYRKPLEPQKTTEVQRQILLLLEKLGPLNIQQIKQETGFLVKEITPALHRLQEAFLIYEDQYDGEWDRAWYLFGEIFPDVKVEKMTRIEALKIVLQRFAYRLVWFDTAMAKSYYKLPEKEIKLAVGELVAEGVLVPAEMKKDVLCGADAELTVTEIQSGFMLKSDVEFLETYQAGPLHFVYAIHRNDFLYKAHEHILKELARKWTEGLAYDHEPLQYLLIDGAFRGASVGHFRNGPYDLNDVVCDLPDAESRKEEIVEAICTVNFGKMPQRFLGEQL